MKVHELKIWPPYLDEVWEGVKRFEVRKNDRDFQVGDWLQLKEWCPKTEKYTGRNWQVKIKYVLKDFIGIKKGYCVIGL